MLQPIDSGVGSILKTIMGEVQDEWLDVEDNLAAWEGDETASIVLNASARRILITKWAGEAWSRLTTGSQYADTLFKCFRRTGAMITIDGSDDDFIRPLAGMTSYTIPVYDTTNDSNIEIEQNSTTISPSDESENDEFILEDESTEIIQNTEEWDDSLHQQADTNTSSATTTDVAQLDSQQPLVSTTTKSQLNTSVLNGVFHDEKEDEQESWSSAVEEAASMKIPWEVSEVPIELNGLNTYVLVYRGGEWDLAKVVMQLDDITFRYKVGTAYIYGQHTFDMSLHGRNNPSSDRWVSLTKSAITHRKRK